ncbi:hypothetical protein [Bradyrhizobium lablabi]|uniref:hypothetical protein n=1 Tax=Bradyrhizobium lablabi TaxID=722472 RepID=UPI001FCD188B|nr:hypothetical protein [Bradyrhizobium lablabi]
MIALAIGYWATLFLMGRREDVLHGDFVEGKERPEPAATQLPTTQLPTTQLQTTQAPTTQLSTTQLPTMKAPTRQALKARPASVERLQSLLAAIKQDLKDAAQI